MVATPSIFSQPPLSLFHGTISQRFPMFHYRDGLPDVTGYPEQWHTVTKVVNVWNTSGSEDLPSRPPFLSESALTFPRSIVLACTLLLFYLSFWRPRLPAWIIIDCLGTYFFARLGLCRLGKRMLFFLNRWSGWP